MKVSQEKKTVNVEMSRDAYERQCAILAAVSKFRWAGAGDRSLQAIGYDKETETILVDPAALMDLIRAMNPCQDPRPLRLANLKMGKEIKVNTDSFAEAFNNLSAVWGKAKQSAGSDIIADVVVWDGVDEVRIHRPGARYPVQRKVAHMTTENVIAIRVLLCNNFKWLARSANGVMFASDEEPKIEYDHYFPKERLTTYVYHGEGNAVKEAASCLPWPLMKMDLNRANEALNRIMMR